MKKSTVKGFLHADGRKMRNGDGEEFILRGWATGNWMNPEGFMVSGVRMGLGDPNAMTSTKLYENRRYDRARTINYAIRELCGSEYAKDFWPKWYRAHLAEADIRCMHEWGYNSIRLPMDASALLYEEPGYQWNEDSFSMLSDLLDLCEKYELYAILDLHGTPGHSGVACDNGIDNQPRLFTEPETFERMAALWEEIAGRFKDRAIVGAYELLNEPLFPAWVSLKDELVRFYDEVIRRIRRIDKNHMIILSGPEVGTNQSIFTKDFDPECHNWAYTFHGYHGMPEAATFQKNLETSRRLNVPAWHGEGRAPLKGMALYYDMLEENETGYSMFCWKSEGMSGMENSPVVHDMPDGWEKIGAYILEGGPRPSYQEAQRLFDELLDKVRFENCSVKTEMFRNSLRKPGIELPGVCYDEKGGVGVSFSGGCRTGNPLNFRQEDQTKMVMADGKEVPSSMNFSPFPRSNPLDELWLLLEEGDFACYSIRDIEEACTVSVKLKASKGAELEASCKDDCRRYSLKEAENEVCVMVLKPSPEETVRLSAKKGSICVISVKFS